ncbi:toxin-antitoxin system YwqK family antitoxin [Formosa undariae]|uniref:Toxin-antitoxin system YwqK family antitoxin n=1 Tax=Formosa undariae TaxID=1325436 RepID=A0ABV5EWN2_9FLAO
MNKILVLTFFTFSLLSFAQQPESKIYDCNKLTMQGKDGKSAFKDHRAFTGKCLTKNTEGTVTEERNYTNGQLNGEVKQFDLEGNLKEITMYSVNIKHGKYVLYNTSGTPIIEGHYKNKLKDGPWKYYDKDSGELIKTTDFDFGKAHLTDNKM